MSDLKDIQRPSDAKEFMPEGATVPFYEYKIDKGRIVEFDTSKCGPPEPMVNAMTALKFIDKDTSVIMINHKKPMGLLDKIAQNYEIEEAPMSDGRIKLLFSYKEGESEKANLNDASCGG